MPQHESHDLESFFSKLTPKIKADLPNWYGSAAQLIDAPSFTPRDWSFFFRYRVRVTDNQEKAILVKIRHRREMNLSQAIVSEIMKQEAQEEFESLTHIQLVFGSLENSNPFFAVRPLGLYEDLNAVVMEEAEIRPLRSFLESPHTMVNHQTRQNFEKHLEQAGRWLNIFHNSATKLTGDGPILTESMLDLARQNFTGISGFLNQTEQSTIKALLEKLYKTHSKITSYKILHDDFNCANVFITPDQRICSFDPKNPPGSPYVDLARFITDLETCRAQILTNGLAFSQASMQGFRAALLKGYFNSENLNHSLLNLFRLLDFLGRWHETESGLAEASSRTKLLYAPALPLMRRYFRSLLRELAQEKNFSI